MSNSYMYKFILCLTAVFINDVLFLLDLPSSTIKEDAESTRILLTSLIEDTSTFETTAVDI